MRIRLVEGLAAVGTLVALGGTYGLYQALQDNPHTAAYNSTLINDAPTPTTSPISDITMCGLVRNGEIVYPDNLTVRMINGRVVSHEDLTSAGNCTAKTWQEVAAGLHDQRPQHIIMCGFPGYMDGGFTVGGITPKHRVEVFKVINNSIPRIRPLESLNDTSCS